MGERVVWWYLVALAFASPDRPFARLDDPIKVARYAKVEHGRPLWVRKLGPIQAWVLPDGTPVRYRRFEGNALREDVAFDAAGDEVWRVAFSEDASPVEVDVRGHGRVDVSAWEPRDLGAWSIRAPTEVTASGDALEIVLPEGRFRFFRWEASPGVFEDAFRERIAQQGHCEVLDRSTRWFEGRAVARYVLRLPDPRGPLLGELLAIPWDDAIVIAFWQAPLADPRWDLGRAFMALLSPPPEAH